MTTAAAAPPKRGFQAVMRWTFLRLFFFFGSTVFLHVGAFVLLGAAESRTRMGFPLLGLALGVLLIFAYRLLVRVTEGRPADELSPAGAPAPLGQGILLGSCLFAMVYAVFRITGHLTYLGPNTAAGLGAALGFNALAAVGEELILRGAVFRVLEDGFGTTAAILLSALLFGLMHGGNPGATLVSSVAIALEAGALLAVAYAATRRLWLPIGLHFGWNFTEGGIFGAAVSGNESRGLWKFQITGSDLFTGGAFGPEASVVAVVVCLLAAVGFGISTVRKGRWEAARFRMKLD